MIRRMASSRGPLGWAGTAVGRAPLLVVAVLLAVTGVLGVFASQREVSGALELFATDSALSRDQTLVEDRFGGAATDSRVQIVFDAGNADVIGVEPVAAAARVTNALLASPEVAPHLADVEFPVVSFATPIFEAFERVEPVPIDPLQAPGYAVDEGARRALATAEGAPAAALYSRDLDLDGARARAGLLLVNFDPDLDPATARAAAQAVVDVVDGVDTTGVRVLPFNRTVLQREIAAATAAELPVLFAAGLGVIALILAFNYRTLSDVVIGLAGLGVAVVWMFGVAVLLGPRYLGVSGPFTRLSNIAPVVFLGLGIDDAIQLTTRYREHQAAGLTPRTAARRALVAVGGAIVLTSATTILGFVTNYSSPIPSIQDFGLFTAIGQLAATTIMLLLVPSVRNLLDTRRAARRRRIPAEPLALTRLVARASGLALRLPVLTILVAVALTAAGFAVSSRIPAQFDRRDFLPRGSDVRDAITLLESEFGGDRNEQTYLLLRGPLATPAAADALLGAEAALSGDPAVRPGQDGTPDVRSIAGLVADVAADPRTRAEAARLGWEGDGVAADADVAGLYALAARAEPLRAGEVLDGDALGVLRLSTAAGQRGALGLRDRLEDAAGPLRAAGLDVTVVSRPLVNDETNAALTASGSRSIVLALGAALLLLTVYFGLRVRRPVLGLLTMTAAVFVVGMVLGTMYLTGIPYNGLTVTVAAIAVGVGVTFAIHMTYRTVQEVDRGAGVDDAVRAAVQSTGAALASSGAATVAGFGALTISSLLPLQQFGIVSSLSILYAIAGAVMVLPAVLAVWGRRRLRPRPSPGGPPDQAPTLELAAAELAAARAADRDPSRFQVRLEWAALVRALPDPPRGVQQAVLGDGGVRLLLVDGRPVEAVVTRGGGGAAPDLDGVPGLELLLPPAHLPAGGVVDDVELDGDVLVLSGRVAAERSTPDRVAPGR